MWHYFQGIKLPWQFEVFFKTGRKTFVFEHLNKVATFAQPFSSYCIILFRFLFTFLRVSGWLQHFSGNQEFYLWKMTQKLIFTLNIQLSALTFTQNPEITLWNLPHTRFQVLLNNKTNSTFKCLLHF